MKFRKRKYEKRLSENLMRQREFLIERLRKEWEEIERITKKDARRKKLLDLTKASGKLLGDIILSFILVGGVLAVAAIAPNVFAAVGRLSNQTRYFDKDEFKRSTKYLKERKYIRMTKREDGMFEIDLTEFGAKKILQHVFGELKIEKSDKWDGIWRLVIFDIPDKHKCEREGIRERLKTMGFYRLQDSVFVFPYPCLEEIKFLASIFNATPYIKFIETQRIYGDEAIKEYFRP